MANYEQLISKIQSSSHQDQIDSFRKLLDLAINDQHHFRKYVIRLLTLITSIMPALTNEILKLLCLQLLSEIVNVYKPFAPKEEFQFATIVPCLSDQKIEVRKSSHLMIFNFVKNYQELDQILRSYDEIGRSNDCPWKLTQKILHSFQSLMMSEPMCVKYTRNYKDVDRFLDFVFEKDSSENVLVKKASSQALTSFVKNKFVPDIIHNLDKNITSKLLDHSKRINYYELEVKVEETRENPQTQTIETVDIQVNNPAPKEKEKGRKESSKTFFKSKPESVRDKTEEFRVSSPKKQQEMKPVVEDRGMVDQETQTLKSSLMEELIQKIRSTQIWSTKCQGIVKIYQYLSSNKITTFSNLLVQRVLELSSNIHFKIRLISLKVLSYMIFHSPQTLTSFSELILETLTDRICDSKSGVRKLASDTLKYLIESESGAEVVRALVSKLQTTSIISRQEILLLLEQIYENLSLSRRLEEQISKGSVIEEMAVYLEGENSGFTLKLVKAMMKIMDILSINDLKNILKPHHYQVVLRAIASQNEEHQRRARNKPQKPRERSRERMESQRGNIDRNYSHKQKDPKKSEEEVRNSNFRSYSLLQNTKLKVLKNKEKEKEREKEKKNFTEIVEERHPGNEMRGSKKLGVENPFHHSKLNILPLNVNLDLRSTIQNQEQHSNKGTNRIYNFNHSKVNHESDVKIKSISKKTRTHLRIQTNFEDKRESVLNPEQFSFNKPLNSNDSYLEKGKNRVVGEEAENGEVVHLRYQELEPFLKVDKNLKRILMNIQNDINWKLQFSALNDLRRVFKFHSEECKNLGENLPLIVNKLNHLMDCSRGNLIKNSMVTISQMCRVLKQRLDPFLQEILWKLLKRVCDLNHQISQEAKSCIESICQHCSSSEILSGVIECCSIREPQIRCFITNVIYKVLVKEKGEIHNYLREHMLVNVVEELMGDSNQQVKKGAQKVMEYIRSKVGGEELGVREEGNDKILRESERGRGEKSKR